MMTPSDEAQEKSSSPVREGEIIGGKYLVGRVLARGGMGVVAEGRHTSLEQRVAIKFLLPEIVQQGEAVQRFLREAQSTAKIESEHVVRVFDVGTHDGVPYLVMEYLDGIDLDDHMARTGPMALDEVISITVQALEGLTRAHMLGIVHRDLKPSNLFLVSRIDRRSASRVKLLDFGISKIMPSFAEADAALTSTKSLLGSPGYMSPEQVRSTKNVDQRTDVWSMGVILYEMLTGLPAFAGETIGDVFAKIREEPLAPLRPLRPDVPLGLERVILRCLERDRTLRFDDAGALLDAILPFASAASPVSQRTSFDRISLNPGSKPTSSGPESDAAAFGSASARTLLAEKDERARPKKPATMATWSSSDKTRPNARFALGAATIFATAGIVVGIWLLRSSRDHEVPLPNELSAGALATVTTIAAAPTTRVEAAEPGLGPKIAVGGTLPPLVPDQPLPTVMSSISPPASPISRPSRPVPTASATAPTVPPSAAPVSPNPKKKDDLGI